MELRVDQLAARTGVAVDTIRFWQARGLLDPPRREGRIGWYGAAHVERIGRIRALQADGLNLATIGRLLRGELDAADGALAVAVAGPSRDEELLTRDELADRSGIPAALIDAVVREGLLAPLHTDGGERFSAGDVDAAAAGLRLLERGLPLPELLALARDHHQAMRAVAERAVALFDEHVRMPLRDEDVSEEAAAQRLVEAFEDLLPATVTLVTQHFRRTLLAVASEHIGSVGDAAERDAVRRSTTA